MTDCLLKASPNASTRWQHRAAAAARPLSLLLLVCALMAVGACGQKGDLYLPEETPEETPEDSANR